jgi:hypothetical protein
MHTQCGAIVPYKNRRKRRVYNTEYHRRKRIENPDKERKSRREWKAANPEVFRTWNKNNPEKKAKYARNANKKVKIFVLTAYSPQKRLKCSWKLCKVSDVDMLTLDHVNNDGYKHRDSRGRRIAGSRLYYQLRGLGYPLGYQTLCANHQLKKAILFLAKTRKYQ